CDYESAVEVKAWSTLSSATHQAPDTVDPLRLLVAVCRAGKRLDRDARGPAGTNVPAEFALTVWPQQCMKRLHKKRIRRSRPALQNGTVPPRWSPYRERRPREYLTPKEVERLIAAARDRGRRYGLRDATMILVAFRHGLRVSELC